MIISKQKSFKDILSAIGDNPVFLIGCNECATLCHSGGEDEIRTIKTALEQKNILVTGWVVLEPACHLLNDKRLLKKYGKEIAAAKKILVFACGNGIQTVAEVLDDKNIVAGTDTLFLGEIKRATEFERRCQMCGECLLDIFGGICPITRCPKSMLNGPCGGAQEGKCEIDSESECIWDVTYHRLERMGKLHLLEKIQTPKNWSKSLEKERKLEYEV